MKVWVAEDILTDYSSGLAVIVAKSEKEAIEKLYEKDNTAFFTLYTDELGECDCVNYKEDKAKHRFENHKPIKLPNCFKQITSSNAFVVWGSS